MQVIRQLATILFFNMLLSIWAYAQMSDVVFFQRMDLSYPGLQTVQMHVANGNYAAAKAAYALHLRTRNTPNHWISTTLNSNYPSSSRASATSDAELSLSNTFEVKGVAYQFAGSIDWSFNPTDPAQNPGYTGSYIREWTVQFNRTGIFRDLAAAFKSYGNPDYGTKLNELVNDWIIKNPVPAAPPSGATEFSSGWRTLEAGYRLALYWPEAWRRGIKSPELEDSTLVRWAKSWMQHGDFLENHKGTLNWLTTESQGIYTLGVFFPEFNRSGTWRNISIQRLSNQLLADVYPDGAFTEIAPHYHRITVENFSKVIRLGQLNNYPIDTIYTNNLERMNTYLLNIMAPDRMAPNLNDGDRFSVKDEFENNAIELFSGRADFQWIATDGNQGAPPSYTSVKIPWAGQIVMRDNWETDGNYLLFEYGPHGEGSHQHEDKLGINIAAYGDLFVFEAGRYAYGGSPFRTYCKSSQAHSIIVIDEKSQNRDGVQPLLNRTSQPYQAEWTDKQDFTYAMASYGNDPNERYGNGSSLTNFGTWRRHILHVKPDIFIIIDVLDPVDNQTHVYQSHFHLNANAATLDPTTSRVTVQEAGRPSFTLTPLKDPNLATQIIQGQQQNEILGWEVFSDGTKHAIPTVRFTRQQSGPVTFAYVFQGAPNGDPVPAPQVKSIPVSSGNFGIMVKWNKNGQPDSTRMVVPLTSGAPIIWGGNSYPAPSILIRKEDCTPIDLRTGYLTPGGILPGPWNHQDIGLVGVSGSACELQGIYRILGSGDDIGTTSDEFHYAYQPLTGDGEIIARIRNIGGSDPLAKGGVMMRESLQPGSKNALAFLSPNQQSSFQSRNAENGNTNASLSSPISTGFPFWVKLVRAGNIFTGYRSQNGQNWVQISSKSLQMPATIYAGLASTSRDNSGLNPAIFDSVQVIAAGSPLPLTISGFEAKTKGDEQQVDLFWQSDLENETGEFWAERSLDGSFFSPILKIPYTSDLVHHQTSDSDPVPGISYYRIKFLPLNGAAIFSNTIEVRLQPWVGVSLDVFPLPCKKGEAFQTRLETGKKIMGSVNLYNLHGKQVWKRVTNLEAGESVSFPIATSSLIPGVYYLNVFDSLTYQTVAVKKVMITR